MFTPQPRAETAEGDPEQEQGRLGGDRETTAESRQERFSQERVNKATAGAEIRRWTSRSE